MHKESCDICREVFLIATSSIAKNFVISGKEQVEMFINAIEESAQNRPIRTPVAARQIKGEEELRKFVRERKAANVDQG